jgi:hypothetical protein
MRTYPFSSRYLLQQLVFASLITVSCFQSGEAAPRQPKGKQASQPVNVALVKMTEPTEKSFTVSLPKGWRNQVYLSRTYNMHRSVMTSLSPDGRTLLFAGDPRLPSYSYPNPQLQGYEQIAQFNPLMKVSNYIAPRTYFTNYTRGKFGKLPGFRIDKVLANPALLRSVQATAKRTGINARAETIRILFSYKEKGKPMRALLNGYAMSNDQIWIVDVSGITTPDDPLRYDALLLRVLDSHRTSQEWKQKEQRLHEQRMAKLRQDYQNNQIAFNASNQRHEMRMKAIQDAGNASMQNWYKNQAASDANHRNFLNYITEEHTVVDRSGKAYQVDNSHQRYYVNKSDNSYIGTDSHTSLNDLRRRGIDPNRYEEVRIKR